MKDEGRAIVPIKVRPVKDEKDVFEVVFGNRRLEAARRLQWNEIDCVIEDVDDIGSLRQEIIENRIREDMTPMDTAKALKLLMDENDWSMRELERRGYGTNQEISRFINLLSLPEDVQALIGNVGSGGEIEEGKISVFHVRALEGLKSAVGDGTSDILKKAADEHLTAEQTRQIARNVSMMNEREAKDYLARDGRAISSEPVGVKEKEVIPVEAEEFLGFLKEFYESGKVLCEGIDNGTLEVSQDTAKAIYIRTGQMYSIWDLVKKTLEKKFGKEVFS